jgi:hypothetical protein
LAGKEDYPGKRVSPLDTGQSEKKFKTLKNLNLKKLVLINLETNKNI